MTQKQLIELIQQHHSAMGETEIRLALNRAQDDLATKTELIKENYTQNSVIGQRYYALDDKILRIVKVQVNDVEIPRLITPPIIDDDEFDGGTGLDAASSSSNERYWYVDSKRLGVVEKITGAVTRDGKTSDYQSISQVKEIRINAIAKPTDFGTDLSLVSPIPSQYHEALVYKVISDAYLKAGTQAFNPEASQIFENKYNTLIKDGKKEARHSYIASGGAIIRPTDF